VVPENIHTHHTEGHWKFRGGGGSQKPNFFKGSMPEIVISGGVGGSNEITFYGGGMDIFWNSTMLLFVSCSIQSQDKRDN